MSTASKSTITPLATLARALRDEPAYEREGRTARTLVHAPDLRVLLVAMRAGATMAEHQAARTVTVQLISGALRLATAEGPVELEEGHLLHLEAGVPHDVVAKTDSAFLLTLGHTSPACTTSPSAEVKSCV
jgi:quercetin dioxygenase-like cupin family protein